MVSIPTLFSYYSEICAYYRILLRGWHLVGRERPGEGGRKEGREAVLAPTLFLLFPRLHRLEKEMNSTCIRKFEATLNWCNDMVVKTRDGHENP